MADPRENYERAIDLAGHTFDTLVGWTLEDLLSKSATPEETESILEEAVSHFELVVSKAQKRYARDMA